MQIGEVGIVTRDVVRLSAFYRWLLRVEGDDTDNDVHQFIITEGTGLSVGIGEPSGNGGICLAFTVDDIDAEYERLKTADVVIVTPPTDRPWGARNMEFHDPDGNIIFFRQIL